MSQLKIFSNNKTEYPCGCIQYTQHFVIESERIHDRIYRYDCDKCLEGHQNQYLKGNNCSCFIKFNCFGTPKLRYIKSINFKCQKICNVKLELKNNHSHIWSEYSEMLDKGLDNDEINYKFLDMQKN